VMHSLLNNWLCVGLVFGTGIWHWNLVPFSPFGFPASVFVFLNYIAFFNLFANLTLLIYLFFKSSLRISERSLKKNDVGVLCFALGFIWCCA
jgi:hypothetical protein